MGIEVQGSRRGRPKKRWADCVKDDLREEVYDRASLEATIVPHRPHIEVRVECQASGVCVAACRTSMRALLS